MLGIRQSSDAGLEYCAALITEYTALDCAQVLTLLKRYGNLSRRDRNHVAKLQKWLKAEQKNTEPPTLANYIQSILSRRAQEGKSQVSQSIYSLKNAAKVLNFPQANNIMNMVGLDEKFKSMIGEQLDI